MLSRKRVSIGQPRSSSSSKLWMAKWLSSKIILEARTSHRPRLWKGREKAKLRLQAVKVLAQWTHPANRSTNLRSTSRSASRTFWSKRLATHLPHETLLSLKRDHLPLLRTSLCKKKKMSRQNLLKRLRTHHRFLASLSAKVSLSTCHRWRKTRRWRMRKLPKSAITLVLWHLLASRLAALRRRPTAKAWRTKKLQQAWAKKTINPFLKKKWLMKTCRSLTKLRTLPRLWSPS